MPTGIVFYTGSAGFALGTANQAYGTERMRITNNGNVGIGTSSPTSLLHGYINTNGAGTFKVENPNAGASAWTGYSLVNDVNFIGSLWTGSSAYSV